MRRATTLLPAAIALLVVAALPAVTAAHPRATGPQPKLMVLTPRDVGNVSYIETEGATTDGPIAATRGYSRTFSGLTPGSVQLLTIEDTVLIGRSPTAASTWLASMVRTSSSKAGVSRLYAQLAKSYAAKSGSRVTKWKLLRTRPLRAGDGAAEVVFRFSTNDSEQVQVGQVVVRVGANLSVISFNGAVPGLSPEATLQLAQAAAQRMRDAGTTA